MKKSIYFIINSLSLKAGGLTKSIYDKANFLSKNYDVTILTLNFQQDFERIENHLVSSGKINKNIAIKKIYIDLSLSSVKENKLSVEFDYEKLFSGLKDCSVSTNGNATRVFSSSGLYEAYISYWEDGKVNFVDYMDECDYSVLKKRYTFYKNELISLSSYVSGSKKTKSYI